MARRRRKEIDDRARLLAKGYKGCSSCGSLSEPDSMRCQGCRRLLPRGKRVLVLSLVVVLVISSFGAFFALSQETKEPPLTSVLDYSPSSTSAPVGSSISVIFTRDMNKTSVERSFSISPQANGTFEWRGTAVTFKPDQPLSNSTTYSVSIGRDAVDAREKPLDSSIFQWSFITDGPDGGRRGVGTTADSFWIDRPAIGSSGPQVIDHPQWVLDALDEGVVMILDHSETCSPCIQQTAICNNIMASGPENLVYFDLLSGESEPEATEVFRTYDPNGGLNYIPLTAIITKVPDHNGGYTIAWHSWEGMVPGPILLDWLDDARAHHSEATGG